MTSPPPRQTPALDGPAAFALVMALLRGGAIDVAARLAPDAEAAAAFLAFLNRHALTGFVYAQAGQTALAAALPDAVRRALRDAYLQQWTQSESLLARMGELKQLLADADVEHLFLKGPLFAQRYYGDIDRRLTGDVDLLVRPASVEAVAGLLRGVGFEPRSRPLFGRRLTMRFTHHFEYQRDGTVVELHWELANHFSYRIDANRLWGSHRTIEYRGTRYPVPSPEYDLVVQLLTLAKDTELGSIVLRSFVDLHAILGTLEGDFDWAAFLAQRAREGLLAISLNMLDLGLEVLAARAEFPALAAALEQHASKLVGRDRPLKGLDLFTVTPPAWGNKRRLFPLYDTRLPLAYGWWILSLPWRLSVYRSVGRHG